MSVSHGGVATQRSLIFNERAQLVQAYFSKTMTPAPVRNGTNLHPPFAAAFRLVSNCPERGSPIGTTLYTWSAGGIAWTCFGDSSALVWYPARKRTMHSEVILILFIVASKSESESLGFLRLPPELCRYGFGSLNMIVFQSNLIEGTPRVFVNLRFHAFVLKWLS